MRVDSQRDIRLAMATFSDAKVGKDMKSAAGLDQLVSTCESYSLPFVAKEFFSPVKLD
jgi:hypothetical protein